MHSMVYHYVAQHGITFHNIAYPSRAWHRILFIKNCISSEKCAKERVNKICLEVICQSHRLKGLILVMCDMYQNVGGDSFFMYDHPKT